MDFLKRYREAFRHLPQGCTAAEVNLIIKDSTQVSCAKGTQTSCSASEKNMIFLRATGEATGVVYSENMEADPLELIAQALENAAVVETGMPQPMEKGCHDRHVAQGEALTDEILMEKAKALSLLPGVMEASVSACVRRSIVLNSLGTETEQCQPNYVVTLTVPGKGEDNFKQVERSSHCLEDIDPAKMLEQLRKEAALCHEELPYITLPAGTFDAVLSSAMVVNVMNTAWQLFAQRLMDCGRSPLRLGERLGSEKLNIVDCPVCPWSGYDYTIDCEGVRGPAQTSLVTGGVITDTLRTLKQGSSNGCAGRADLFTANINTELISVPRNIWIVPGSERPEELVERMGTGIHLTYSMDEFHSLNIAGASFSIPCGGVYYENGKPVGRLQQMNLCGTFRDLLCKLEAVGCDMNMKGMWPHYDYCFGGPSLLVRGANFAM